MHLTVSFYSLQLLFYTIPLLSVTILIDISVGKWTFKKMLDTEVFRWKFRLAF